MPGDKRPLRAALRAARATRPVPDSGADALWAVAQAAGLLDPEGRPGVTGPQVLAAYLASSGEPDPVRICAEVRAAGGQVVLPIPHADRTLGWACDDGRSLPAPGLPVRMPAGPQVGVGARALVGLGVRVVLVPALAVDRSGTRLGQGGGYYDRLLAELVAGTDARPALVAVVHDDEVLPADTIPRRSHDVPVEAALTESALVRLGAD